MGSEIWGIFSHTPPPCRRQRIGNVPLARGMDYAQT